MLEREKYHEAMCEEEALASDGGGEDLEVIGGDEEDEPSDNEAGKTPSEEDASSSSPLQVPELDAASKGKAKGKGRAKVAVADGTTPIPDVPPPSETEAAATGKRRRRPPVDPFAGLFLPFFAASSFSHLPTNFLFLFTGYGGGPDTRSSAGPADTGTVRTSASRSGTKVRRIHTEDLSAAASSGTNTPSGEHKDRVKGQRKRSKKKVAL